MSQNNKYIPTIYLVIYSLFKEKSTGQYILYSDIREIMNRRLYSFPRKIHFLILEEMCDHNLLKKIDKIKYQLNNNVAKQQLNHTNIDLIK